MPNPVRMQIGNWLNQSDYTASIEVGANRVPVSVVLDTGSSALGVDGGTYSPDSDATCKTTQLAQVVQYGSGGWVGAVVQAEVSLSADVTLPGAKIAVTYASQQNVFGQSEGIWGLAYQTLDHAYLMPADTWKSKYDASDIALGREADLDPYFEQLESAGLIAGQFAFCVKRSIMRGAIDPPSSDPLNSGTFVVGGGVECADLYTGAFAWAAVTSEKFYNTNLLSVRVANQPAIAAPQPATGSTTVSNSIIDSGTSSLQLDQGLYDQVLNAFGAIDGGFADKLQQYNINTGNVIDQTQIDLTAWPQVRLTFQGVNGSPAAIVLHPSDYWQFDACQVGMAVAVIAGDGNSLGGQSILGLPLFSSHYVVFDRTAANGRGAVGFATQS